MFKWVNKSLAATSSAVLAVLLVILIGAMEWMSYSAQKNTFLDEMERIGFSQSYMIDMDRTHVFELSDAVHTGAAGDETAMDILGRKLDAMTLNDLVSNTYLLQTSLTEREGLTIAKVLHSNEALRSSGFTHGSDYELNDAFAKAFENAMRDGHSLSASYEDEFGEWITFIKQIHNENGETIGMFAIDFDFDKVEEQLNLLLWKSVGIAAVLSVLAIALVIVLVRMAVKPLKRLAEVAEAAAQGDLTQTVPVKGNNEIAQVSRSFNAMTASLRQLTGNIRSSAAEVASSSANMQQSAEQTSRATEEVTEAIQEVAAGSETQLQSFQEIQRAMGEMTAGIGRIAESASSVSDRATDTSGLASNGEAVIRQTLEQMGAIEAGVTTTVQTLNELKEHSGKIGEILALIAEVADQTNLLALNASIEAARAGEHGNGFAVVAVEIRKLAERSKQSSEQIADMLGSIDRNAQLAAAEMEQSVNAARLGSSVSQEAGESFRQIVHAVQDLTTQIQEVSAAVEQMSAGSEEIAASLDQLEHIALASAEQSQRVAAASEEQLASMQEVASGSVQLRTLATSLNEATSRFKV